MRIDLLTGADCPPVSGEHSQFETINYHTERNAVHTYWSIHDRVITPHIAETAPENSLIVDVGGGARLRPLDSKTMRKRGQRLVTIDYQCPIGDPTDEAISIQADLRKVPKHFGIEDHLRTYVRRYGEFLRKKPQSNIVDNMCKQLKLLYETLEHAEIGTVIFSHVLAYLAPSIQRQLIGIGARSLAPGGSMHCMEMPLCYSKDCPSYPPGIMEMQHAAWTFPDLRVTRDTLLAPALPPAHHRMISGLLQMRQEATAMVLLSRLVRTDPNVEVGELPATFDNGEDEWLEDTDTGLKIFLPAGVRWMTITKTHD